MRSRPLKRQGKRTGDALTDSVRLSHEIAVAAPHTIAHRTGMMLSALGNPTAAVDPELRRMVDEKVSAGIESATAMLTGSHGGPELLQDCLGRQIRSAASLTSDLAHSRSPVDLFWAQLRYSHASAGNAAAAWTSLIGVFGAAMLAGTRPVHRIATANARRLTGSTRRGRNGS